MEQTKEWFNDDSIGTVDEMRAQMQLNYDAKRILLPVGPRNTYVDLMLILSDQDG